MTKDVNFVKKFTSFGRLVREQTGFLNKSNEGWVFFETADNEWGVVSHEL
jgi:hypothetical protein